MVKLSDIDLPMIFKNKLLFSHGFHNNLNILPEEVAKSLRATNWDDQRNKSLFYSHSERDAQKWVGRINNPHVVNGELFGDLEIHDADLAMKLGPGKAPIGVSAEIKWPPQYSDPTDFTYRAFAMVPNPEVPETMINFSQQNTDGYNVAKIHTPFADNKVEGENNADFAKVTAMEEKRKDMGMSLSEFYAAPRDPPSNSALPIFDAAHVRNALARFNQTKFLSESEKTKARGKIRSAAKKFAVDVHADFSDGIVTSETARGSPIGEETENSNLMSAERGLNKEMENNANNIAPEEEVKEEVVEVVEEEVKEEAPAEKAEESKEADFAAFNDKFKALSAKVKSLEDNFAKFSEEAEQAEPEVAKEAPAKEAEAEEVVEEVEEVKEEVVAEESKEEAEEAPAEESKEADFSKIAEKLDKLADAISKKDAAPMSTAEFGNTGNDKEGAVIDRLTSSLSK